MTAKPQHSAESLRACHDQLTTKKKLLDTKAELLKRLNFAFYLEQVPIRIDKFGGGFTRFRFNEAQQLTWDMAYQPQLVENKPIRTLYLKARRLGVSSQTDGFLWHTCRHWPGVSALISSHDKGSAHGLYRRVQRFDSEADRVEGAKEKIASNREELEYAYPHHSRISFTEINNMTKQQAKNLERGASLQLVHLSEAARYNAEKMKLMLQSILPIVPYAPRTAIVWESTAEYTSGEFHDRFMDAWEKPEASNYQAVFLPWFIFDEYQLAGPPLRNLDTEFRLLRRRVEEAYNGYELTDAQLRWYRDVALKDICSGSWPKARQEYPSFPKEAFQSSGSVFFDPQAVERYETADETETMRL